MLPATKLPIRAVSMPGQTSLTALADRGREEGGPWRKLEIIGAKLGASYSAKGNAPLRSLLTVSVFTFCLSG